MNQPNPEKNARKPRAPRAPKTAAQSKPEAGKNGKAKPAPKAAQPAENRPADNARRKPFYSRTRRPQQKQKNGPAATPMHIIPLGGLGEVGKNITLYECQGDMLMVDCGLVFPDSDMFGIDLVIPDFTYVVQNKDTDQGRHHHPRPRGPHRRAALSAQAGEPAGVRHPADHRPHQEQAGGARPAGPHQAGGDPARAEVQAGLLYHRAHPCEPLHPRRGGLRHRVPRRAWSSRPATSRSTTPRSPAGPSIWPPSRNTAPRACWRCWRFHQRRAAGLYRHRAEGGPELCEPVPPGGQTAHHHRHLCLQPLPHPADHRSGGGERPQGGRVVAAAWSTTPRWPWSWATCTRPKKSSSTSSSDPPLSARKSWCIVTTGSQGEPMSALSRMSGGSHRNVRVGQGDFIIISATPIPGNEKMVTKVVNSLLRLGAEVIYESMYDVHTSGHAYQEEQKADAHHGQAQVLCPGARRVQAPEKARHDRGESLGIPAKNITSPRSARTSACPPTGWRPASRCPPAR